MGVLRESDVFLLASDGLTGMIDDDELHGMLKSSKTPQEMVGDLINEANRRGGLDNITAIVVRIDALERNDTGEHAIPHAQ
jgi:protein phosphatase